MKTAEEGRKFVTELVEGVIRAKLQGLSGEKRKTEYARIHYKMIGAELRDTNVFCRGKLVGKHLGVTDDWKVKFQAFEDVHDIASVADTIAS